MPPFFLLILLPPLLILLIVYILFASLMRLWLQAFMANAPIPFMTLVGMRFRRVNAKQIVAAYITLVQAGRADITTDMLQTHYLARGNIPETVRTLLIAHRAKVPLPWDRAVALDLAGPAIRDAALKELLNTPA